MEGIRRAALYIRVSTEEQAMHGYSLDAQEDALRAYVAKHGYKIVDIYRDEGKSASKKFWKRTEFMRMIADVEQDRIDVILFVKLDRWFRSVKDYYKMQEILDKHHVTWETTEEKYETTTADGSLYVNIRLSLAEDEARRTSNRIKFVFENKVAHNEVITAKCPIGLKIVDKHFVPDPQTAPIVQDLFRFYETYQSEYKALQYLREKYNIIRCAKTVSRMLAKRLYIGEYRNVKNYCEPIVDKDQFERVQKILQGRSVRHSRTDRIYIFSGIIVCAECGRKMAGHYSKPQDKYEYTYYICSAPHQNLQCDHNRVISERAIESYLLEHIEQEIDAYGAEYSLRAAERAAAVRSKASAEATVRRKLERLKELYVNDLIDLDGYKADRERLTAQLEAAQHQLPPPADFGQIRALLQQDFVALYNGMPPEDKRALWRSCIREIRITKDNVISFSLL